jgi:hypothetical protein
VIINELRYNERETSLAHSIVPTMPLKNAKDDCDGELDKSSGVNIFPNNDDFVFSDQVHQQEEFRRLSTSLANLGWLDKSLVDDAIADTDQSYLYQQQRQHQPSDVQLTSQQPLDPSSGSRRESKLAAYQQGQEASFLAVLDEVEEIERSQASKGLSNKNFTFGLMNCLLIAYTFGAHPEHFWIFYLVETIFWVSWKFHRMWNAKPLCEVLYYLDFCWVMNFSGVLLLLSFVILANERVDAHATLIPTSLRKQLFLAAFGIFAGPVSLAAMALPFVAFLFHDVNTMANLVIHLMPSMAMYNLRWHARALHAAYPTFFNLQYLEEMQEQTISQEDTTGSSPLDIPNPGVGDLPFWNGLDQPSVARNALLVYLAWWFPYTIWMLLYGLKLPVYPNGNNEEQPQPKYNTVFHSLWRGGPCELVGSVVWKRPKQTSHDQSQRNDFEVRDLMFYMTGHAIACITIGIGVVGSISYLGGQRGHALMLLLATTLCAQRGAQRYTYYVTTMYGQKLRKVYKEATTTTKTSSGHGLQHSDDGKKSN